MTQTGLELADARRQSRAIIIDIREASCRIVIGGSFRNPIMHVISDESFPLTITRFVGEPRFEIEECLDFAPSRLGHGDSARPRSVHVHSAVSIMWRY